MTKLVKYLSKSIPPRVRAFLGACRALCYDVELYYSEVFGRRHMGYYVVVVPSSLPSFLVSASSALGVIIMIDPRTGFSDDDIDVSQRVERFIISLPQSL